MASREAGGALGWVGRVVAWLGGARRGAGRGWADQVGCGARLAGAEGRGAVPCDVGRGCQYVTQEAKECLQFVLINITSADVGRGRAMQIGLRGRSGWGGGKAG